MIESIARIRGKHPLIVEVPVLTRRLSSYWLMLVTPLPLTCVARPLIEGLRNTTVAHDEYLRNWCRSGRRRSDAAPAAISARRNEDGAANKG